VPAARTTLTPDDVHEHVEARCFSPRPSGRIGVEVEWLAVCGRDPQSPVPVELAGAQGDELPAGSRLTFEPGGQIELSAPPLRGIGPACASLASDAALLGERLAEHGVGLVGLGLDPRQGRHRAFPSPRYDAMERYFDAQCAAGATMMCSTAAVQVNLDVGTSADEVSARWHRAHDLGPTLSSAFANSPLFEGGPSGWKSRRLAVWSEIDTGRTGSAEHVRRDPGRAWAEYALEARVMLIRHTDDHYVPLLEPMTFAEWIAHGHELGFPTVEDLEYHLTTLFPPVRPRGWLELRMIDSLPDPWWRVAVAVATTLVCDDEAADAVADVVAHTRGCWREAARHGPQDPALDASARACFGAALEAMVRLGTDAPTVLAVESFLERYVERRRCPADDRLEAWEARGALFPEPDKFAEVTWV
jgi:glutamate--cysteine ligase